MTASTRPVTPDGHDPAHWSELRSAAPRLDLPEVLDRLGLPLDADRPLVVLSAHPDDETLGLGRLIHRWVRSGGPVTAVVASAGEACFDHVTARPEGLAERRLAEWRAALAVLGVQELHDVGLPDGSLSYAESALDAALDAVVAPLLDRGPAPLLAAPWRGDPHPDHRAAGRVSEAVAERYGLPSLAFGVWMTYWSEPEDLARDDRALVVLTRDPADDEAHGRATAEFTSQLESLGPGLGAVVPPGMLAHQHEQLLVLPADASGAAVR